MKTRSWLFKIDFGGTIETRRFFGKTFAAAKEDALAYARARTDIDSEFQISDAGSGNIIY